MLISNSITPDIKNNIQITHKNICYIILFSGFNSICLYIIFTYTLNYSANRITLAASLESVLSNILYIKDASPSIIATLNKAIITFIIYVILEVFICIPIRTYCIQNIYMQSITSMRNALCEKYNIYDKSFIVSNIFKEYVINQCYVKYIQYAIICDVILSVIICMQYSNYIENILILIMTAIIMYINAKTGFVNNKSKHMLCLIFIIGAKFMLYEGKQIDIPVIMYIVYFVYQYANYNIYNTSCKLNITLKYYGNETIDWTECVANNIVLKRSNIYRINQNVEQLMYDIANTYYHNKPFYLANEVKRVQYAQLHPNMFNVTLIDQAFNAYDENITVLNNIQAITNCTDISNIYEQCKFTVDLNAITSTLSTYDIQQMLCLCSIASLSDIILIPMFDVMSSQIQSAIITYAKTQDKLFVISSNLPNKDVVYINT